ncbi:MAG: flagellar basal body-associated FliL family protein [Lachnospiraceae bacterium]
MKKNLMSVLIMALVMANLVLTAILMISVVPQTKKANELVTKVCSAIDLELEGGKDNSSLYIPMSQVEPVSLSEGASLTINLKDSKDGEKHHAVISVTLALDTKSEGYKTYGVEGITAKQDIIKSEIIKIVSSHTLEDMKEDRGKVEDEVLTRLRRMFESDFIVSVVFPTYNYE